MSTWGIIPAAGDGSRTQPLAFSKELLPVGSRFDDGAEPPRVVCEYLIERMIAGGARKICFVISPGKSDILEYFGGRIGDVDIAYMVQSRSAGLCDTLFRASAVVGKQEQVLIGLPDTVWFPVEGFGLLPDNQLSLLLFPVKPPQSFEAVVIDRADRISEIQVNSSHPQSNWTWGAVKMPGETFHRLHDLWRQPGRHDQSLGTLVNAYVVQGGHALGIQSGIAYVDVATPQGYREALEMLDGHRSGPLSATQYGMAGYTDGWRPLTAARYAATFPQQRVGLEPLHRSNR